MNTVHFCSFAIKKQAIHFLCSLFQVRICNLLVICGKSAFQHFVEAHNNSYRILNRLPIRCSQMFAVANVNSCKGVTKKVIYRLITRIDESQNRSIQNVAISDVEIVDSRSPKQV